MIRFVAPHWLLLLPALAAGGYFFRGLALERPLRAACLVLAVLVLAEPELRRQGDGLDLWVLVDQSDSARESVQPRLAEWQTILESSRGPDDRIFYVDFAAEAVTRGALLTAGPTATEYSGGRSATRLASAITHALGRMPDGRAARILALTDGSSTEPLDGVAEKLVAKGIALDVRLPPGRRDIDVAVARLVLPRRVAVREGLVGEIVIRGDRDGPVPLEILRDGMVIGGRTADVSGGTARLRFTDRLDRAGAHRYGVRLLPEEDSIRGNNSAEQWVEVTGGPRILLVTAYTDDPLAAVLGQQGLVVDVIDDLATLHVGLLTGAEAVILNNVPASKLDVGFVKALDFYVTGQGGGLAMIGGKTSFAAGGWHGSALDPLLPVSMELKQEHRKLAVALAIVMDRSGSMAVTAPGTTRTKMSLAGEAAARAIDLLGDNDSVVLIPVDSAAHPLSAAPVRVGPNRASLVAAARGVESLGGGIFCFTGLKAAWEILEKAPVGQRHVILFADAADAEEPGEYRDLLAEMRAANASVSVIGLGDEHDVDAAFLQDVAARGGGRIFFSADAVELPALFAMETATIARSAFLDEPVAVRGTPGWSQLAALAIDWLPEVDGYNLCYAKPGAVQAAVSGDDYAAPLVAFWQRGTGRTAAVTLPLGGDFSTRVRGWDGYGGFVQSLVRWLVGAPLPPGVGLRTTVDGSRVQVELFYDAADRGLRERLSGDPPELLVATGSGGAPAAIPWEKLAPGHYATGLDASDGEILRGAIRLGSEALPFGPINITTNPEWSFDRARLVELAAVANRSGGGERIDLADVWQAPRPVAFRGLARWLVPLLIAAVVLEAFQTQTGSWLEGRRRPSAVGRPAGS